MLDAKEPQATVASPGRGSDSANAVPPQPTVVKSPASEIDYHLTGSKLYVILAGIGLAIFLFALDISVVSTVRILQVKHSISN